MQAIILAGGKGTRLRPLTLHTPKPILPIAGRPFLVYQLELLKRAGVRDVTLSLSYQPQKIEDKLGDGIDHDVKISYTVESQPLGTAGAYRNAAASIKETAIVLNGDILTDVNLSEIIAFHRDRKCLATIALARVADPAGYGLVEIDEQANVRRFIEKPKPEEITSDTINAGIYVLEPGALDYVPQNEASMFEYGVFPRLLQSKETFCGFTIAGYWLDIGTSPGYLQANLDVIAGRVQLLDPPLLARGEKFDRAADIDSLSLVDPTCTLKAGAQIINSVIGRNCYIEEKAKVENSVVRGSSRIGTNASVRGSVIGKSCHVGRSAVVSEGASIGDKSVLTDYSQI